MTNKNAIRVRNYIFITSLMLFIWFAGWYAAYVSGHMLHQ